MYEAHNEYAFRRLLVDDLVSSGMEDITNQVEKEVINYHSGERGRKTFDEPSVCTNIWHDKMLYVSGHGGITKAADLYVFYQDHFFPIELKNGRDKLGEGIEDMAQFSYYYYQETSR